MLALIPGLDAVIGLLGGPTAVAIEGISLVTGYLGYRYLGKDIEGVFVSGVDAVAYYKKAAEDGVFTEEESKILAAKTGKFVSRLIVAGIKIKRAWNKMRGKK